MNVAKSPGAVAARGAVEIDELGWHVISQTSPLQNPTQARIRAALTQCNDGCDAGINLSRAGEMVEDTELSGDIPQASPFGSSSSRKSATESEPALWSRLRKSWALAWRIQRSFLRQKKAGPVAVLPWPDRHKVLPRKQQNRLRDICEKVGSGGPHND